ncbi:LysR family transcriptional regulator [Pigmentiphaga aceris]|uniref:LysR family transcriptional regulator n=1 Tax=Pigmentiphaga aceris TaxID=1940612 RepID=A0A5C0B0B1_9BURK|nr:LysR family transcriptional regulator [Pigmentiphaga aceris]QEI08038.1 LysR family transcriptional regulator [Pigmentiphaga aceris]
MDELRRLDLNLLLTLHTLLTEKHVTRAALQLHKSQPAVSHALAQLRERFDDPLLVRRGGGLSLTPRAQALMQPLAEALGHLNALLRTPVFEPSQVQRRFRLALSDYAARLVLPPLIRRLRTHAPGLDLSVSQASRDAMLAQLADGEIDLALGVFPTLAQNIQAELLFEESFVCIADKNALPARGGLSLDTWLARPHVLVSMRPDDGNEIDQALDALGLHRRIALALPHWSAALEVVAGTDLILTIARRSLPNARHLPGLRQFAAPLTLPRFAFQQAWHVRRDGDAAHAWLRREIWQCSQATHPGKP